MDLTDQQWAILEPLFQEKRRANGRGRPWRDARDVLNGVLWVLRTGAPWKDLPDRYPPYQTAIGAFSSGNAAASFAPCWSASPKIFGNVENWI